MHRYKQSNGFIDAESEIGKGSKFHIFLLDQNSKQKISWDVPLDADEDTVLIPSTEYQKSLLTTLSVAEHYMEKKYYDILNLEKESSEIDVNDNLKKLKILALKKPKILKNMYLIKNYQKVLPHWILQKHLNWGYLI